ncbi:MAG: hypothetical protein KDC87_07955 [Planctomycetes bacterium]|nr:hypothetical protein [Planctomycetota bacterium]MCB9872156.1 hypothetical protein [Planctomycetota bacterium]
MTDPDHDVRRDSEQRLRELTAQALELLDQLAESRLHCEGVTRERDRLIATIDEMNARCSRLEEALADARRRVRSTRSMRAVGRAAPVTQQLDVVFRIPTSSQPPGESEPAASVPPRWFADAVRELREHGVEHCHFLCPPDYPADELRDLDGLILVEADRGGMGPALNLAMASTDAPLVLVVVAGAQIDGRGLDALAAAADESVALAQPALRAGRSATIGMVEHKLLELERLPVSADQQQPVPDFVAPEAFVVRRGAFVRLGTFDEDLIGPSVVLEFCLRLRELDYQILPVPGCKIDLPEELDAAPRIDCLDRDRLVILARHRPRDVAAALGSYDSFWQLPSDELGALTRALYVRLPGSTPATLDLFVAQVQSLVGAAVPARLLDEQLEGLEEVLGSLRAVPVAPDSPRLFELAARMQELGSAPEFPGDQRARMARMVELLQLELAAKQELHAIASGVRDQLRKFTVQHGELESERDSILEQQRAALQRTGQLEHELRAAQAKLQEMQTQRDEHSRFLESRCTNLEDQVRNLHEQIRLGEIAQQEQLHLRNEARKQIAASLDADPNTSTPDLAEQVREIRGLLRAREDWIVMLLQEAQQRGVIARRRKLAPHEERFIETRARRNGS